MALNKAKIITVTSVKGGAGKSTTVLNLAGILANMGKKTIIVDLDLYSGVIGATLNLNPTNDIYTLCDDVMNNRFKQMEDYTKKYNEYLDVLVAPLDPRSVSKIKAKTIELVLNRLSLQYDVILIDTNHVMDQINLITLDLSDDVLYLITNDLLDLKNMKTMTAIFKDMELNNYKIILNEPCSINSSYSLYQIKNVLGTNIDYIIPKSFHNRSITKYVFDGKIMTLDKNIIQTKGGKVLIDLVQKIMKGK